MHQNAEYCMNHCQTCTGVIPQILQLFLAGWATPFLRHPNRALNLACEDMEAPPTYAIVGWLGDSCIANRVISPETQSS